jgi:hypothetical protein
MSHKPVCVRCNIEFRPEKVGIEVLDMAEWGPYQLWNADLWKCPSCGIEIIPYFGDYGEHHNSLTFMENVKSALDRKNLYLNKEYRS